MNVRTSGTHDPHSAATDHKRSVAAGVLIGIGVMAALDEIVFHQLLGWHHFYDRATPAIALFSDGLLHAGELLMLVAGFSLLARLRERHGVAAHHLLAGFFLGLGGFQVFDGIVDHKVLRLHQIRYGVTDLWLYDTAWILAGVALALIGTMLYAYARSSRRRPPY